MCCSEYTLHLWSMTSGQPHPAAGNPTISYPRIRVTHVDVVSSVSITNSRLAILVGTPPDAWEMVVWDWRTGRILLVSEPLTSVTAFSPTNILG